VLVRVNQWPYDVALMKLRVMKVARVSAIFIFLFAQFILVSPACAADKQAEGMALIKRALELTDLRQSGPYRMRSTLTVADQAVGQRVGEDTVVFSSPKKWRRDLRVTGYSETAVFIGDAMFRARSQRFTPPSMRIDLGGILRNLPEMADLKVLRVYNRKLNNIDSRCVYLTQRGDEPGEVTWCLAPDTGLPVAILVGDHSRIEFSDYTPLGSKFVPRAVRAFDFGKRVAENLVQEVTREIPDDPDLFKPPLNAEVRPWCDNMKGPTPTFAFAPDVPIAAVQNRRGLEQQYEISIRADGTVAEVVPMAESRFVDRVAIEAISRWQFKPALCGNTPVPTDVAVDLPYIVLGGRY
jgi:hypothetical protein